jgi:HSP20 family protein
LAEEVIQMAIIKWDPFKDLLSFPDEMSKAFGRTFGELTEPFFARGAWSPNVDMYEKDSEIVVKVELPGLTSEDIDVSVDEDTLTIKGEREFSDEVNKDDYYRIERRYGAFQRVIPLPAPIKKDEVKAAFKEGVLEVKMPRLEAVKPKQIKVTVEAEESKKGDVKKKK